jgi:hypothetical protein
MSDNVNRLLTSQFHISQEEQFAIDGGDVSGIETLKSKEDGIINDDSSWTLGCSGLDAGLNQDIGSSTDISSIVTTSMMGEQYKTPEVFHSQNSEYEVVGNKFLHMISDESHHSKWEEFRKLAQTASMNEECTNLLRRMELEESDYDGEIVMSEMGLDMEGMSLCDLVEDRKEDYVEAMQEEKTVQVGNGAQKEETQSTENLVVGQVKKRNKRKGGSTLKIDRLRRSLDDGRTMMQKAQHLREAKDQMKGMTQKTSFAFESNEVSLEKALSVNIAFGNENVHEKLDNLKKKELNDREIFERNNPEVNLLSNLDIVVSVEAFPPLSVSCDGPVKDPALMDTKSWVQAAFKSGERSKNIVNNDRSILEH